MTISNIVNELNLENGSNYKMAVLEKHKDNKLLQKVLKMTYCKVSTTFGVTMKNVVYPTAHTGLVSLEAALIDMEQLVNRSRTGNDALAFVKLILSSVTEDDAKIIKGIINRDLRINMGRSNINKVFKNLIVKPAYARCDIGTDANIKKNINFNEKVYSQLKLDGTYRSMAKDTEITSMSRSGQEDSFPIIKKELMALELNSGVFIGELTLKNNQNRSKGNGLINSDNPPHEDILFTVWDIIPLNEYAMNKDQIKQATKAGTLSKYEDRFAKLEEALQTANLKNVELVEYKIINSMTEAYCHFQEVTERGDEGTVIKAHNMVWKDGTSKQQLKVKLEIDAEVRITGFIEGKAGTKRTETFGSLVFENDEGTIKGSTSGFTDEMLEEINSNRESYIGKVMTVQFNDVTKGRDNEYYALSHPRFIEIREDKDTTDTLERVQEMKEMAMSLENK